MTNTNKVMCKVVKSRRIGGRPKSYTEEQKQEAIQLYNEGIMTNREIVEEVGLSSVPVLQTIMRNYRKELND